MDIETLQTRLSNIDTKFAETKTLHDQAEAQVEAHEVELHRLQGEYRMIQQLISELAANLPEEAHGPSYSTTGSLPETDDTDEGDIGDANEPKPIKLHPVDDSGIPAEATVMLRGKR